MCALNAPLLRRKDADYSEGRFSFCLNSQSNDPLFGICAWKLAIACENWFSLHWSTDYLNNCVSIGFYGNVCMNLPLCQLGTKIVTLVCLLISELWQSMDSHSLCLDCLCNCQHWLLSALFFRLCWFTPIYMIVINYNMDLILGRGLCTIYR